MRVDDLGHFGSHENSSQQEVLVEGNRPPAEKVAEIEAEAEAEHSKHLGTCCSNTELAAAPPVDPRSPGCCSYRLRPFLMTILRARFSILVRVLTSGGVINFIPLHKCFHHDILSFKKKFEITPLFVKTIYY